MALVTISASKLDTLTGKITAYGTKNKMEKETVENSLKKTNNGKGTKTDMERVNSTTV